MSIFDRTCLGFLLSKAITLNGNIFKYKKSLFVNYPVINLLYKVY